MTELADEFLALESIYDDKFKKESANTCLVRVGDADDGFELDVRVKFPVRLRAPLCSASAYAVRAALVPRQSRRVSNRRHCF